MLMLAVISYGVGGELASQASRTPDSKQEWLYYHSVWNDNTLYYWSGWTLPTYIAVRFHVPLVGGANTVVVDSAWYYFVSYQQHTVTDTITVYDDGGTQLGLLVAPPFTGQLGGGIYHYYPTYTPDASLGYTGSGDTAYIWLAWQIRAIGANDTLFPTSDTTAGDPYTGGYNYYGIPGSWNDMYDANYGYDWFMDLFYHLTTTDVAEGQSRSYVRVDGDVALVRFAAPVAGGTVVAVYDATGRAVILRRLAEGTQELRIPLGDLGSGVYLLKAGDLSLRFVR